jgi:ParB-like nuclease family protein
MAGNVGSPEKPDKSPHRSPGKSVPLAAKATAEGAPRLEIHPAAQVFSEMPAAELQELADDIKQNGLAHSIIRDTEGVILDGRNRLKACEVAGVGPRFETYKGDNPVGFIISSNLRRRHLNESQRALVAAKLATLKLGDNQHTRGSANLPTQAAAALMLNISERSVRDAVVVRDSRKPEIIRAVEEGKVSVSAAAKQVKPPKRKPEPKPKSEPSIIDINILPIRNAYQRVEQAVASGNVRRAQERLRELLQAVKEALK